MTTHNRELLTLAAKAAGYDTSHPWNTTRLALSVDALLVCKDGTLVSTGWNPLEDDGDALRLAGKLNLRIDTGQDFEPYNYSTAGRLLGEAEARVPHGSDRNAATRLAIVRAAAEIGRAMA